MTEAIVIQSTKKPKRRKRQPASEHQIAVNRANAAKSTGPTSPEGKAHSSQNAVKHGLCASRFTVVRLEDTAEIEEVRANLVNCYRPVNSQELEAIDCMARAQLSMRRAAQLEASLLTSALSEALVDPRMRMEPELKENIEITKEQNRGFFLAEGVRKLARESNSLSLMLRYQAHAERQYRRAVEEFERLKKLRPELPNEPISPHPFPTETVQSESVTAQPPALGTAGGLGRRSPGSSSAPGSRPPHPRYRRRSWPPVNRHQQRAASSIPSPVKLRCFFELVERRQVMLDPQLRLRLLQLNSNVGVLSLKRSSEMSNGASPRLPWRLASVGLCGNSCIRARL